MDAFDKLKKQANDALAVIESVSSSLKEFIEAQAQDIVANQQILIDTTKIAETAHSELKELKISLDSEKKALLRDITPLRSEKQRLNEEIAAGVARKGDLKMENTKLEQSCSDFKKYEEGAWKVLNAKDEELQNREKALRQKEALTPVSSSLLPPRG